MPTVKKYRISKANKDPKNNSVKITIPPDWIKYFGLKPGDEVKVFADGMVIIIPNGHEEMEQRARKILDKEE